MGTLPLGCLSEPGRAVRVKGDTEGCGPPPQHWGQHKGLMGWALDDLVCGTGGGTWEHWGGCAVDTLSIGAFDLPRGVWQALVGSWKRQVGSVE